MDEQIQKQKKLALEHLRTHPLDYNGAAECLEMSLMKFMEFRGLYLKEFLEVEEEVFNRLEHLVMLQALGQPVPEEYENFDFTKAKWILQCRKGWSVKQQVERIPTQPTKPTGRGKQLLDNYLSQSGDHESGTEILPEKARRKLQ